MEEQSNVQYEPMPQTKKGHGYVKVYHRRWYMLFLFSMLSFTNALVWNTWGPISDSAVTALKWNSADIANFANIGNVAYALLVFPCCYVMDVIGLRVASLICGGLMLLATGLRCISDDSLTLLWMSNVASVLNGMGGPLTFAAPALFSIRWFPPHQRATATAIVSMFNYLGVSCPFLIGPALVRTLQLNNTRSNLTVTTAIPVSSTQEWSSSTVDTSNYTRNHTADQINGIRGDIMRLMYIECGWSAGLFLLFVIYFPARPPLPPSAAANTPRVNFLYGLKKLFLFPSMWLITLAYSIPTGPFGVWPTILNVIFKPIGVSQWHAGWLGFYSSTAGAVAGLFVGRFSDVFTRHIKAIVLTFYVLATASLIWCLLLYINLITFSLPQLYVSGILAGVFINGAIPLFYELASEVCFPIAEGIVGGFLTFFNNAFGILFLIPVSIPQLSVTWVMWTLPATVIAGIPLLLLLRETYGRLQLDLDDEKERLEQIDESVSGRPQAGNH